MTPEQVRAALDQRRTWLVLSADEDLTGDLLLLAFVMFSTTVDRRAGVWKKETGQTWLERVTEVTGWGARKVSSIIASDFPRYDPPPFTDDVACQAPMVRRAVCGRPATSTSMYDIDPATGERTPIGVCSKHRNVHDDLVGFTDARRHYQQWKANGEPTPAHNAGGVLARYFRDMDALYAWAAPYRRATPGEGKPPRPVLRLIPGGVSG